MVNKLRLVILASLAVVVIFIGASYFASQKSKKTITPSPSPTLEQKTATLVINFGEEEKSYDYIFAGDKTAFDILKDTLDKENIALKTQQYDFGVFVKSIGDKESSADMAWIYFVNGESGQIAADQMKINQGDKVEWRYVKPE